MNPKIAPLAPHSEEAEKGVLGCILLDPTILPIVMQAGIIPQSFYSLVHRDIYTAIVDLHKNGTGIDAITLGQSLRDIGKLEGVGGLCYLSGLPDAVPSAANLEYYLEILEEKWDRRRINQICADISEAGGNEGMAPAGIAKLARDSFESILREHNSAGVGPWLDLLQDASDMLTDDIPPVVELVEGIVPEQSKLGIVSGAKSFKTWLTINLAIALATGTTFLGRSTLKRKVLYVNLELKPDTFKRRTKAIADALGVRIDPVQLRHLPLRGRIAGKKVAEIITLILETARHIGAEVIILDPLYKLNTEGDENKTGDQTRLFNELDRLTVAGHTVILNDHSGKGNQSEKDPLDVFRGSSAKGGDLDAAMVLRKHEEDNCYSVDMVHRELPPVAPFVLQWEYPLMKLREDLDADKMKKVGGRKGLDPLKLLKVINEFSTPSNTVTVSEWARLAKVNRTTLLPYTEKMRKKGWIRTIGEGNHAGQMITKEGLEAIA